MKTATSNKEKTSRELLKSEPSLQFMRMAKFKPHSIVTYGKFVSSTTRPTQTNTNSLANLEKVNEQGYNGYMSDATRRNVKGILENLLTAIELNTSMAFPFVKGQEKPLDQVYPTFVTLTLPAKQMHCDNDIKRDIFTPFMQEIIRNWNVKCYVWVAETQKNGNLHFHVLMDRGIPALRLRQIWNKHLNSEPYEYINCYRRLQKYIYEDGFVFRNEMWEKRLQKEKERAKHEGKRLNAKATKELKVKESQRQKEAYRKGIENDWSDPNSTDIHSIQNIKKLTAYVTKYFTKKPAIIKPKLAENQVLLEEAGKYYIVTNHVVKDEQWGDTVVPEKVEHTPQFENRKLRGRIWGAAEVLKAPDTKPCPYTIALKTYTEAWNTYRVTSTRMQTFRVEVSQDLFGAPQYQYQNKEVEHVFQEMTERKWFEEKKVALKYLEVLEKEEVSEQEIKEATAKAGPLFASQESNRVIPLREPQKDYLQKYSPDLWEEYQAHYRTVFDTLYPPNSVQQAA